MSSLVLGQRLDYLAEGRRPWLLLVLLSLALFLPGLMGCFLIPPFFPHTFFVPPTELAHVHVAPLSVERYMPAS